MAALVGSTELRGMVDPHVELVFAERALRHAATASATIVRAAAGQRARPTWPRGRFGF